MVSSMPKAKVAIRLEADQIDEIRGLVAAGQTASVAAFVKQAVDGALGDAAVWREMLDEALQQTGGALTQAEKDWADAILSAVPHPKP